MRSRFKEATRAAILTSAEQTFGDQGFEAARMEDIAALAGLSVGTLYNYFADRQALILALMEARRAELFARLDEALREGKNEAFVPRLRRWVTAAFEHFSAHQRFISLMLESSGATHGLMRKGLAERANLLLQPAVREGILRAEGAGFYPPFLLGMIKGSFARSLDLDDPFEPKAATEAVVRFFLDGAGKRKG